MSLSSFLLPNHFSFRDFINSPIADPNFQAFVFVTAFLTLPIFSTYFALRVRNLVVAAMLTWIAILLSLAFAFVVLDYEDGSFPNAAAPYKAVLVANLGFALLACFLLRHSLSRRIYSF